jgi:hypothetical protein
MRRKRVIDLLREKFPDLEWKYEWGCGHVWSCSDGSYVCRVARLAPRYDGDDDTFVLEYYRYFNGDKIPERIFLMG